jgi:pseudouridine synthase
MMRVQKYLSRAGHCSRREGEDLMRQGRIRVNGDVCRELGTKVDPETDTVEVDGRPVELPEQFTYLVLFKPEGYVTTLDDPRDRPTVVDLLDDEAPRLWPVGRLDQDSSGLLLMTDDGVLTHRLTHPSYEARKRYRVAVRGELQDGEPKIARLRDGVRLDDGYVTEPAEVAVRNRGDGRTVLEVTLTEGKNRQIRRMVDAIGDEVLDLERVAVGPLTVRDLEPGETRSLEPDEIRALYDEVDTDPTDRALPPDRA